MHNVPIQKGFPILRSNSACRSLQYKTIKEIDQYPGCSNCMKRCDSCKNFVDHVSSFECFATKRNLKSGGISHAPHQIWFI